MNSVEQFFAAAADVMEEVLDEITTCHEHRPDIHRDMKAYANRGVQTDDTTTTLAQTQTSPVRTASATPIDYSLTRIKMRKNALLSKKVREIWKLAIRIVILQNRRRKEENKIREEWDFIE